MADIRELFHFFFNSKNDQQRVTFSCFQVHFAVESRSGAVNGVLLEGPDLEDATSREGPKALDLSKPGCADEGLKAHVFFVVIFATFGM